jgi:hypothetical protein
VNVTGTVSLRPSSLSVTYGQQLRLAGTSSIPATDVTIQELVRGERGWSNVGTVTSGPDGSYATSVLLKRGGSLRATIAADQIKSDATRVELHPILAVRATPLTVHAGTPITVQAHMVPADAAAAITLLVYDTARKKWRSVARKQPTIGGIARFRWAPTYGRNLLRVSVAKRDPYRGFADTTSRIVTVTGTGTPPPPPVKKHHSGKKKHA